MGQGMFLSPDQCPFFANNGIWSISGALQQHFGVWNARDVNGARDKQLQIPPTNRAWGFSQGFSLKSRFHRPNGRLKRNFLFLLFFFFRSSAFYSFSSNFHFCFLRKKDFFPILLQQFQDITFLFQNGIATISEARFIRNRKILDLKIKYQKTSNSSEMKQKIILQYILSTQFKYASTSS